MNPYSNRAMPNTWLHTFKVAAEPVLPAYANFVVAGTSGMSAWMLIHPVDVIKTRMQLLGKSRGDATAISVGKELVRSHATRSPRRLRTHYSTAPIAGGVGKPGSCGTLVAIDSRHLGDTQSTPREVGKDMKHEYGCTEILTRSSLEIWGDRLCSSMGG